MQYKKIAIIGSGISGLTCSYLLNKNYDITLFEANSYIGGHTNTEYIDVEGTTYPINTGFIVFNNWTYPNFIKLLQQLNVKHEDSSMSFSVHCEKTGLEYNGSSLNQLFAQRKNLINPRFIWMVREILRFNKQTVEDLNNQKLDDHVTLEAYLESGRYSQGFIQHYIIPMGAAIWSCPEEMVLKFPITFFIKFFSNHGMLNVKNRPTWQVISGGSQEYVKALTENFQEKIALNTKILRIEREPDQVILHTSEGQQHFDAVVIATHSDQALKMLAQPTDNEKRILSSIPYQANDVVLHTDTNLLPQKRLAWGAWNYHLPKQNQTPVGLTYNMNILQNFHNAPETFCVTLNKTNDIDPTKIIKRYTYHHPVYSLEGMQAQTEHHLISGHNRTYYCGAYWFNGFHEDGVNSALRVTKSLGVNL